MTDLPVRVHPRVGLTPSSVERSQTLPQNVAQLDAGQQFYVEFWVGAPAAAPRAFAPVSWTSTSIRRLHH